MSLARTNLETSFHDLLEYLSLNEFGPLLDSRCGPQEAISNNILLLDSEEFGFFPKYYFGQTPRLHVHQANRVRMVGPRLEVQKSRRVPFATTSNEAGLKGEFRNFTPEYLI